MISLRGKGEMKGMKKSKKLILMIIEIGGTVQKDRNPVRAGLVEDPTTYPWSSCAIYATGTPISSSPDPRLDCRDARWTTQRAVGSREFLNRYLPLRGRRRMIPLPQQIRGLEV